MYVVIYLFIFLPLPELIYFGWGQDYDEEPPPRGQTPQHHSRGRGEHRPVRFAEEKSELASSRGGAGINLLLSTPPKARSIGGAAAAAAAQAYDDLNPHETMAIEMATVGAEGEELSLIHI